MHLWQRFSLCPALHPAPARLSALRVVTHHGQRDVLLPVNGAGKLLNAGDGFLQRLIAGGSLCLGRTAAQRSWRDAAASGSLQQGLAQGLLMQLEQGAWALESHLGQARSAATDRAHLQAAPAGPAGAGQGHGV